MFAAIGPALALIATWAGRIGLVLFAYDQFKNLTSAQKETMAAHSSAAAASGLPEEEQKKLVAATTYEQIEKNGKSPDDFWNGLTDEEKGVLKYSPDTVRSSMERTSFLGTAQTILWVAAAAAASYGAFKGIPIVSKGLGQLVAARQRGAGATELLTFIEQTKMGILQKVWVPGTVATIAAGGGWLTGALANNMNDAFLWGPTFLDQAAADVEKAFKNKGSGTGGTGGGFTSSQGPRTIIRMVEEKKPQQFLGTLFSAKLGKLEHFDRKLDDEITDMDDLETDVKLNVNKWLQTLPGRMGYSIVIRKDPVDETGVQQSGIWATATLHILQLSGKILPIDTILLGPVTPQVRLELARSTKTVETQIDGIVSAAEIREIDVPSGVVDIFSAEGKHIFPGNVANQTIPEKTTTPAPVGKTFIVEQDQLDSFLRITPEGGTINSGDYGPLNKINGEIVRPSDGAKAVVNKPKPKTNDGTLRRGDKGEAVRSWQIALNSFGERLAVDGDFGSATEAATKRFQQRAGITVDGIVGPKTYAALTSGRVSLI